ncbi:hypothetical protein [Burkholderia guangdongensis]|uniref:hypothetical protein n=1 Tax=Burkholderia guangdongensis TaxID=1792500 RepID=UPI0015CA5AE8|nr:hypothetical protein [Burkholderia guangdongensis]
MRDSSVPFRIAAARGVLDAGCWANAATLAAAGAGWWIAASWAQMPVARVLLAIVSTTSGGVALWLALRIAIDRRLFAALDRAASDPAREHGDALAALDRALADLGWIDGAKAGRALDARVRGTIGLCRRSVVTAFVQGFAVGIAIAVGGF